MSAPFIVKTVSRIHPGKAEAYRPVAAEICALAEENAPRLLAFHIYVTEDRSSEVVLQLHPDAESMQHHLGVLGEKIRNTFAYTDFESLEIYGQPNDALREWIPRVSSGVRFTHHPVHWGGFTRPRAPKRRRGRAAPRAPSISRRPRRARADQRSRWGSVPPERRIARNPCRPCRVRAVSVPGSCRMGVLTGVPA